MSSLTGQQFQPLSPEILGDEIISLYAGCGRKKFTIHKKLLCDQSGFFKSAFTTENKETIKRAKYRPWNEPSAVQGLINYLYRGSIPQEEDLDTLITFYFLAEELRMENLMDRIMDKICSVMKKQNIYVSEDTIEEVYSRTNDDSKLRLFCAGNLACNIGRIDKDRIEYSLDLFRTCPKFFRDLFNFQAKYFSAIPRDKSGDPISIPGFDYCEFHAHEKDNDCLLKLSDH